MNARSEILASDTYLAAVYDNHTTLYDLQQ